jgi:hypothetical protein
VPSASSRRRVTGVLRDERCYSQGLRRCPGGVIGLWWRRWRWFRASRAHQSGDRAQFRAVRAPGSCVHSLPPEPRTEQDGGDAIASQSWNSSATDGCRHHRCAGAHLRCGPVGRKGVPRASWSPIDRPFPATWSAASRSPRRHRRRPHATPPRKLRPLDCTFTDTTTYDAGSIAAKSRLWVYRRQRAGRGRDEPGASSSTQR